MYAAGDMANEGSSPHARGAREHRETHLRPDRDHPRMRGEHDPPRGPAVAVDGIIPACAGSTYVDWETGVKGGSSPHARGARSTRRLRAPRAWDHPRMRGEHAGLVRVDGGLRGIIPACAGSTCHQPSQPAPLMGSSPHARGAPRPSTAISRQSWDHPRMRGEHGEDEGRVCGDGGIIPACAGSTRIVGARWAILMGSSPHARGAHRQARCQNLPLGDHPRMRGEHWDLNAMTIDDKRIIPACAGSTPASMLMVASIEGSSPHARGARSWCSQSRSRPRDHPRMRGEHQDAPRHEGRGRRDHPRMRGEHRAPLLGFFEGLGIIPACAGSTVGVGIIPACAGSTTPRDCHFEAVMWIIPACAGSTHL